MKLIQRVLSYNYKYYNYLQNTRTSSVGHHVFQNCEERQQDRTQVQYDTFHLRVVDHEETRQVEVHLAPAAVLIRSLNLL